MRYTQRVLVFGTSSKIETVTTNQNVVNQRRVFWLLRYRSDERRDGTAPFRIWENHAICLTNESNRLSLRNLFYESFACFPFFTTKFISHAVSRHWYSGFTRDKNTHSTGIQRWRMPTIRNASANLHRTVPRESLLNLNRFVNAQPRTFGKLKVFLCRLGTDQSSTGSRFTGISLNTRGVRIADQNNESEDLNTEPEPFAHRLIQGLGVLMIAIGWIIYRRSIRWRWPWWLLIGLLVWLPGLLIFYCALP